LLLLFLYLILSLQSPWNIIYIYIYMCNIYSISLSLSLSLSLSPSLSLSVQYYISVIAIVENCTSTPASGNASIFWIAVCTRNYKGNTKYIRKYIYVYTHICLYIDGYSLHSISCLCKCYFEICVKFGHTESCFRLLSVSFQWYWVSFSRLPTATNITGVAHVPSFLTEYHWINDVSGIIWRNEIASMKMVPRVSPIPEKGAHSIIRNNGRSENGWLLTTS